jgi:hypothetical protein
MLGSDRTKAGESEIKRSRFPDSPLILRALERPHPTEPMLLPPVIPSQPAKFRGIPAACRFFEIKLQMGVDRIPKSL